MTRRTAMDAPGVPVTPEPTSVVVVGRGGLLGSAVARAVADRAFLTLVPGPDVPWQDPARAVEVLATVARSLDGTRWQVMWCAGTGVNGMTAAERTDEIALFAAFLDALPEGPGTVFLASSAGGVYAGSTGAPYDESSVVAPMSEYGRAKLGLEQALEAVVARRRDLHALIGRLSNLYGPGQDMQKPQGLISHVCAAAIDGDPMSIYVPLETVRDYLFVDDAARMVLDATALIAAAAPGATTKVFCSHQATTISTVLETVRRVAGRPAPVRLGSSPLSAGQSRDLRLRSVVLPEIDARALTPFDTGVAATWADLRARSAAAHRSAS